MAQGQCSALRKFDLIGAITALLTWIKCADLQKRYPLELGGVLHFLPPKCMTGTDTVVQIPKDPGGGPKGLQRLRIYCGCR